MLHGGAPTMPDERMRPNRKNFRRHRRAHRDAPGPQRRPSPRKGVTIPTTASPRQCVAGRARRGQSATGDRRRWVARHSGDMPPQAVLAYADVTVRSVQPVAVQAPDSPMKRPQDRSDAICDGGVTRPRAAVSGPSGRCRRSPVGWARAAPCSQKRFSGAVLGAVLRAGSRGGCRRARRRSSTARRSGRRTSRRRVTRRSRPSASSPVHPRRADRRPGGPGRRRAWNG